MLLPLALFSIAWPSRISAVISALLQNESQNAVDRAPKSPDPAHRAAAMSHSISIHRLGQSERPNHTPAPINAPIRVGPTISPPAERASWPSLTSAGAPAMAHRYRAGGGLIYPQPSVQETATGTLGLDCDSGPAGFLGT